MIYSSNHTRPHPHLTHLHQPTQQYNEEPVLGIAGRPGSWAVDDLVAQGALAVARARAVHHSFPDPLPANVSSQPTGAEALPPRVCRKPWAKRLPRKQRIDAGTRKAALPVVLPIGFAARLPLDGNACHSSKRARIEHARPLKAPASEVEDPATDPANRGVAMSARKVARLAAGRTLPRLMELMDFHFFHKPVRSPALLVPRGGLFGALRGQPVFIVGVFTRYRVLQADVILLQGGEGLFAARLADNQTVLQADLNDVGVHYIIAGDGRRRRNMMHFRPRPPTLSVEDMRKHLQATRAQACLWHEAVCATRSCPEAATPPAQPQEIMPATLRSHIADMARVGESHVAYRRRDRACTSSSSILDIPEPITIWTSTWECATCHKKGIRATTSHRVTQDDIKNAYPNALVWSSVKWGRVYMTPLFLLHLVNQFHDTLNLRACRRQLVSLYCANTLSQNLRNKPLHNMLASVAAVPRVQQLRSILCECLEAYLPQPVRSMQRCINVYSGTGVRNDGNFDIASRIQPDLEPISVLLAFLTTDGLLYDVPAPKVGEDIESIIEALDPVIDMNHTDRMEAGLTFEESAMVFHATDTFGRHRLRLREYYRAKYRVGAVSSVATTPKAPAHSAMCQDAKGFTTITGDMNHCVFDFQRCVPVYSNDASVSIQDFRDIASRLDAKLPDSDVQWNSLPPPAPLLVTAHNLLAVGVENSVAQFRDAVHADGDAAGQLKAFLEQPKVVEAATWMELFDARPPRRTVARLARHCGADLHASMQFVNHRSRRALRGEVRRFIKWYMPGRRRTRRRRGILRRRNMPDRLVGGRTIFNKKVRGFFRRLLKPLKLQGLWRWRRIALALHSANVPVTSGTTAVERFWAKMLAMLPPQGRRISLRWYRVLGMICFLRYNYSLVNQRAHLPWAECDPLLAQRIASMEGVARALHGMDVDGDAGHLQPIFDPFR